MDPRIENCLKAIASRVHLMRSIDDLQLIDLKKQYGEILSEVLKEIEEKEKANEIKNGQI